MRMWFYGAVVFCGLQSGGGPQRGRLQIRCARVGGVEIPNAKRVEIALTYIHGVGQTTARQILLDVGLENKITKELSEEELTTLRDEVSKYMIEGDLVPLSQLQSPPSQLPQPRLPSPLLNTLLGFDNYESCNIRLSASQFPAS